MANDGQPTPAADGAATAGKGQDGGTGTDAHLQALQKVQTELGGVQKLLGRFGQQLGDLRTQVEGRGGRPGVQSGFVDTRPTDDDGDPVRAEVAQVRQELAEDRRERALDRFMRTTRITPEDWNLLLERLAANEAVYHRFNRAGQMDYFTSYDAAWKDLQLERFNTAKSAADQQRAEQDRQRDQAKRQAVISGAGAVGTEGDEVLDVSKMSSAEYFEKVLKPAGLVDPNDPPSTKPYLG